VDEMNICVVGSLAAAGFRLFAIVQARVIAHGSARR
jgi:hypothetical protein